MCFYSTNDLAVQNRVAKEYFLIFPFLFSSWTLVCFLLFPLKRSSFYEKCDCAFIQFPRKFVLEVSF